MRIGSGFFTGRLAGLLVAGLLLTCFTAGTAQAETIALPGNAETGANASAQLTSVACASAGNCVAVGDYQDSLPTSQPLIETETSGSWTAAALNLDELGINSQSWVTLNAVACPSAGNCVAVGEYDDSTGNYQGLVLTESAGVWTAAQAPAAGLNASSDPDLDPQAISCTAVGYCVAVGTYNAPSHQGGLILVDSGGVWSAMPVSAAGLNVSADPPASLVAVTCPSTGNCVAVGQFIDSSSDEQGLIETESNGDWSATKANISGLGTAANPTAMLETVSCPSAGDCTAAGYYVDASSGHGSYQLMLVASTDSTWGAAVKATLPANANYTGVGPEAGQLDLYANSISCTSVGNCMVVGSYDANSPVVQLPLELSQTNGVWGAGTQPALPGDAAAVDPTAQLGSVSCWAAGACEAAGAYITSSGALNYLVLNESNGAWSELATQILTGAQSGSEDVESLACTTGGYCAVAGWGFDGTGMGLPEVPFLADAPGSLPAPSATDSYTSAMVAWSAPSDNGGLPLTGYDVTADNLTAGTLVGSPMPVSATTTSATISGLVPGDDYTFTVTPTSLLGNGLGATSTTVAALASVSQIKQSLAKLEHPKTKGGLKTIRKRGLKQSYVALEPGRAAVRWYHLSRKHRRKIKTLIASSAGTAGSAQTIQLHIKLNAAGRRLAKTHKHLRITELLSFTPTGGSTITVTKAVVLG